MKYAIIILVALYLIITYGCSPDSEKKATKSHEQTTPASVEALPAKETVALPVQHEDQTATVEATEQTGATEQPADVAKQPVETEHIPEIIGVTDNNETQTEVREVPPTIVKMPCGRKIALADLPPNAPCLKMQQAITDEPADEEETLTTTLQNLVDTTSEMVLATRQMAITLQEMLDSETAVVKEAAEEKHIATETLEKQDKESTAPEISSKQIAIEMMQEVIDAAQDVIDATNKAISQTLETRQQ